MTRLLPLLCLGLVACGPGPATSLAVASAKLDEDPLVGGSTGIKVTLTGDGDVREALGEVLVGSKTVAQLSFEGTLTDARSAVFGGTIERDKLLKAGMAAPTGGTVKAPVTLRFTLSTTVVAERQVDLDVGCGAEAAICNGACADLKASPDHCGACGNVCSVELAGGPYKGRCINSRCNWPGVTVTAQSSCAQVCSSVQFKGQPLSCANVCGYTLDGYVKPERDVWYGAAVYVNSAFTEARVIGSCSLVPEKNLNGSTLTTLSKILCCCGP